MLDRNLVLLSYGNEVEYRRAIFCILSFSSWYHDHANDTRIVVYTDDPGFIKSYLNHIVIEYVNLTPALLDELTGDVKYLHRIKVAAIDLTFKRYPDNSILFIDTDTFFYKPALELLRRFSLGVSFMHKREYKLEESIDIFSSYGEPEYPTSFLRYINGRNFSIGQSVVNFNINNYVWNSGVLGLDRSLASYLPDIFTITDAFYVNSKWFISEQLAFSLVLQSISEIKPADQFIHHYWGKRQKALMDNLIKKFLKQHVEKLPENDSIRATTLNWRRLVLRDMLIEQAVGALQNCSWYFGLKKIVQLTLTGPKSLYLLSIELLKARKN